MKTKKRYFLVLFTVAFLALCYFGGHRLKTRRRALADESSQSWKRRRKTFFAVGPDVRRDPRTLNPFSSLLSASSHSNPNHPPFASCRMENCFDFSRCKSYPYKHFVYPSDENVKLSANYRKVLNVLRASPYYTEDPEEACLFVLSLDTLNRDKLSPTDYVDQMPARLERLDLWNGGLNHVIFNLYSGTYPDYTEDLGFDVGKAMLAKASIAQENYREGFDVSIPLFHDVHPERGGSAGTLKSNHFPVANRYFLVFKGKRYLHGIGSESRDSLYHLHNARDIILVTTCKHGKDWESRKDDRCDADNREYDR